MCNKLSRIPCGLDEICDSNSLTCISGITQNRGGKKLEIILNEFQLFLNKAGRK